MESEEVRHLDVAIRACGDLKRLLLISLLHVQILSNKYDQSYHETQLENSAISRPTAVVKTDSIECPRTRSVQSMKNVNNSLAVQLIKIRRNIETILTKLDFLLNRYGRKNTISIKYLKRKTFQIAHPPKSKNHSRHKNCFQTPKHCEGR